MSDVIRLFAVAAVVAVGGLSTAGCSGLTKVSAPDTTQPPTLETAAGALVWRAGALGQFYVDMSVWAGKSGELTDELISPIPGGDAVDLRVLPDAGPSVAGQGYTGPLSRVNLLEAIALLQRYDPVPGSRIGELFAALGTIETVMAEDLCTGVPLATVVNGVRVAGTPLTTAELRAHALAQFDSAARYAADSARILHWAAVGRARALVDEDSIALAVAAVVAVPTGYAYDGQYSATTNQQNYVAEQMSIGNLAVSDREGINGLNFATAGDPRVPIVNNGVGLDGFTTLYAFGPYTGGGVPLTIAGGVEARLIEAEAALAQGNVVAWAADLNALRADSGETGVHGLLQLTADSTTLASSAMQVGVMFRERAFWLFAAGHRQGDLRRLIRQYGRTQAQVFPTGLYKNTGLQYGTDVTFPIVGDNANTAAHECINRNP